MAASRLPSISDLCKLIDIDPETGEMTWAERPVSWFSPAGRVSAQGRANMWNGHNAGKPCFNTLRADGYLRGSFRGKEILTHRLIWAMHYGAWPEMDIDHINGDRADNRLQNLRLASRGQNSRNKKRQSNNTSGHTGVALSQGRWRARIWVRRKLVFSQSFATLDEAVAARDAAQKLYDFGPNHGT